MKKLGVFVGEQGNWSFFTDIFADLQRAFRVQVFAERRYRLPLLSGRVNRWAFEGQMRAMLRENDACFFEWASELLWPASLMRKAGPIVTRLHSYELNVWAPRVNWRHVNRIVCVSENIRRRFSEQYPEHASKTTVVPNGVALDRFVPGEERTDTLNLGMLGSLHPVKRIYEAILTVHDLRIRGYRPHLHIGGGPVAGGYFDSYAIATRRLVEKLGLDTHVTFHGHVSDPARWLQGIDVFLSNSYWEGQQVALLEALASGCYCVAHAWDGAEEVLAPSQLFLTGSELQDLVISFDRLTSSEKRAARQASRAVACERFDIERTKRQIRDVLAEVAAAS